MTLLETIKMIFTNISLRDPCKRCLVRASCSQQCDLKYSYWVRTGEMPILIKICSFIIIFGSLVLVYCAYAFISTVINN
jgi:hypothetical protein